MSGSRSDAALEGARVLSGLGRLSALFVAITISLGACTRKSATTDAPGEPPLAEKGKAIYLSHCTSCHNADPKKAGSVGPEVWGSSLELLEARVLRAEYPPGYAPKRNTKAMTAMPYMTADIPALHAYLNQ